jgi:hypothetical protein
MEYTWEAYMFIIGITVSVSIAITFLLLLIMEVGSDKFEEIFAGFFIAGLIGTGISLIIFLPISFHDWDIGKREVEPREILVGDYETHIYFEDYKTVTFTSKEDCERLDSNTTFWIYKYRDSWGNKCEGETVHWTFND